MCSVRSRKGTSAPGTPHLVERTALFERLSAGETGEVTLISARAGSGKTVLLRSWIEHAGIKDLTAWVSVRPDEHDPQRFWLSVVQQLRTAVGRHGFVEKVAPAPEFNGAALVERLLSELRSLDAPIVLLIDDVHELRSPDAQTQLADLIARRPPQLRIVLASRHDPQLGLHRLRLAGQLTELRDADLRFTLAEARDLLANARITVSDEALALLHARTEGWAAGLRLAALSIQERPDAERFVRDFSGSDRTVADYLLSEVLARQPEPVRRLLLRTSILDRVSGSLADRLLGMSGSERLLLELERQNAFVVAIDPERSWFRYHQLLRDLLRLELRRVEPEAIRDLHRTAARWFAEHGDVIDAVRHAQAGEDWPYATRLLADHGISLALNGQSASIGALVAAFPTDVPADPEVAAVRTYYELTQGSLEGAERHVAIAEHLASAVPNERRPVFGVALAIARLTMARRRGDVASILAAVRPLLAHAESDGATASQISEDARAVALMNLGVAELWSFKMDEADGHLEQALSLARRIARPYVEVACLSHLALVAGQRSLAEQRRRSEEAIAVAEAHGFGADPVVAVALATMGTSAVIQGRFAEGRTWLDRAERVLPPELEPATAVLLWFARGLQHAGEGEHARALAAFRAAEELQARLMSRHVMTVQARELVVQTQLRLGDLTGARTTLGRFSEEDRDWSEARAARAALHLAEHDPRAAVDVLAPVLDGKAPFIREFTVIEALLFDAIARETLGDPAAADSDVERALDLAERDALVAPFVMAPARELLARHAGHRTAHAALLADILDVMGGATPRERTADDTAVSDLSESELRVLRYLPSHLSAQEIGGELFVSVSTVKTHMRHVYEKLGVHRRTEAVERARDLGLLSPSVRLPR